MKIVPILTEKTLGDAAKGYYSFWVEKGLTKHRIRNVIEETFGVKVQTVRTMNYRGLRKKNYLGRIRVVKPKKKAVVTLKGKDKIDLFETKKK